MIKQLKSFTVNLIAGANVATVLLLVFSGYADHLNPDSYPLLSVAGMFFPFLLLANLLFLFFWLTFKWRKLWIPLLGFVLAYKPLTIFMPLNPTQTEPDGTIKMLSYNVCQYGGNFKYEEGFDTVYHYLARQDADIVCIQEDVDTWRRYVMQRYAKLYPYNDTIFLCSHSNLVNGMGIHTRFPILKREQIPYPSRANGSVAWHLKVGRDTVVVINNHLESTHLSDEDRDRYTDMLKGKVGRDTARQESKVILSKLGHANAQRAIGAEAVRRYMEAHRQYPIIVCGDFNDTPLSYSRHLLSQGMTDCFVETGRGLGLSYNRKGFNFRIDHILVSDRFVPYNCEVDSKMDASDHYPILCRLKLVDKP